ncbi:MAG TPA: phenylacetate--CoA ligase family protein, partial [Fimbriiglobus sp.]|nr:phenylacetate--CoA ligase family protein [Fimbriiglobus sp.]
TAARIREFTATVRRHRPGLLFGHAHSLYLLACQLKKAGVDDVRPDGILSTAMPLHDWQRTVIEEVFGVPATNRYGCEEVSLIACECERHRGLHVAAESVFTEVEPDGKLLVTDLSNPAMPLIRYRIGDVVTATDRVCDCGRGLPLLEKVEGRDADYVVTPAGGLISGISLTENFALHITGTAQVQIVQEAVTFLRIRMVADETFGDASRRQIAALVKETFGSAMRYVVELVDLIPQEPGGKYRFCISKVAEEHLKALTA